MVAHRRAALSCSRRSPRGRTSGLGAPREPRAYRCTGSAAGERGQRHALWFCLSAYCTRLSRALVGSVDPVCPGLTAPGALPLAQRLRLPPGPTTVVAPAKRRAKKRAAAAAAAAAEAEQERGYAAPAPGPRVQRTPCGYRVRGPGGWDGQVGLQSLQTHCAPKKPVAASELTSQEV